MPGPAQRDYYEVLGMARDASPEDIKKAYRKLAIRHHPDRNPDDKSAEEQFKEASEAYAVLGDPEKRSRYDRFGHAGVGGAGQTMNSEVFADFQDLFRGSVFDLFGEMFGGGNPRAPAGGRDIQYELSIDFSEPKEVSRKRILVSRSEPCDSCRGSGVKAGKQPILCGRCGGRGQETFSRGFMVMSRTCSGCSGAGKIVRDPCRACGGDGRTPRNVRSRSRSPRESPTGTSFAFRTRGSPALAAGRPEISTSGSTSGPLAGCGGRMTTCSAKPRSAFPRRSWVLKFRFRPSGGKRSCVSHLEPSRTRSFACGARDFPHSGVAGAATTWCAFWSRSQEN